jgi:hypothetical protein
MSEIKVNLVQDDNGNLSLAQKEEAVLEQAVAEGKASSEVVREKSDTVKVDLRNFQNKQEETDVKEEETQFEGIQQVVEETPPLVKENSSDEVKEEEEVVVIGEQPEQITEQPLPKKQVEDVVVPENLKEVVRFMEETGGTLEDYVRLNSDYSNVDNETLLKEYYKKTRPNLDADEIDFLIEDQFSYDEEYDDEKTIRKRKMALKEEIANAQKFLSEQKDKYYKEVKLSSKLSESEREAIEFYNKYNEEQELTRARQQELSSYFIGETKKLFTDFKGFDFSIGDKKFRYSVKNPEAVMNYQSDISNLIKEFVDNDNKIKDVAGWHKALYQAKNGDAIAQHFYEQGRADAIKDTTMKSKNIDMDPRQIHQEKPTNPNGIQVKALDIDDSSKLKIKFGKK